MSHIRREGNIARCDLTADELNEILNAFDRGDLVPVVRCKDCKHSAEESYSGEFLCSRKMFGLVRSTDFCSFGERKDGADE